MIPEQQSEPVRQEPAESVPAESAAEAQQAEPTVALPTVAIAAASTATKVRIDTPGVSIDIEAHESLAEVAATALRLFHEAGGWPQEPIRSSGFAQAERRSTPPAQSSSMQWAPGPYPVQMP